ncbi:hypothetical protein [Paracoccus sp. MKU1]|uniref:hypothetical protein n=1 Tax=Paracoccus sp. MKU1 TaxID=1745182 RepID=UPI000719297B|nr:hypothetical protein [Paracoccus sp. MKU1]
MTNKYSATLVSGKSYTMIFPGTDPKHPTELTFKRGVPRDVTEAQKEELEEKAVDEITLTYGGETRTETRAKFAFAPASDDPAPRSRAKPAA